jgi:glycosyltransferase involved in cell wall biosynthesis
MSPSVSICVPTYNGEKYIQECLDSILTQTFTDFEVLIVDDQSSDNTLNIAREYSEKDQRIKVIQNEKNLGLVGNWNRCVELANGEWIKFVFQDDLIAPECLERMLTEGIVHNSAIVCCQRDFLFETGTNDVTQKYYLDHLGMKHIFAEATKISAEAFCKAVLNHPGVNFIGEPTTVLLHRTTFSRFGIFNPNLIQICDTEFWTRVASHEGIIYIPEILASFRVHEKSTSTTNHSKHQYRIQNLELLVLLHEFALHPIYAPLRVIAAQQSPPIDLLDQLENWARFSKKVAVRAQSTEKLEELEQIVHLYPILARLSQQNLFGRALKYPLKKFRVLNSLRQRSSSEQAYRTI